MNKKEKAKQKGREKGKLFGKIKAESKGNVPTEGKLNHLAGQSIYSFMESSEYKDDIEPQLRKMAGFEDDGTGKYPKTPNKNAEQRFKDFRETFKNAYLKGFKIGFDEGLYEKDSIR